MEAGARCKYLGGGKGQEEYLFLEVNKRAEFQEAVVDAISSPLLDLLQKEMPTCIPALARHEQRTPTTIPWNWGNCPPPPPTAQWKRRKNSTSSSVTLENGRKMVKNQFSIDMENLNIFSKISYPNWFLAQTRKDVPLIFLIYFRFTNDFQ